MNDAFNQLKARRKAKIKEYNDWAAKNPEEAIYSTLQRLAEKEKHSIGLFFTYDDEDK